jgi:hypothetical protein
MRRLASALVLGTVLLGACSADSTSPVGPTAVSAAASAQGSGSGGGGGGGVPAPTSPYNGYWIQDAPVHLPLFDGSQDQWFEFSLTMNGTTGSGTVNMFITDYDAAGNITLNRIQVGRPAKVTATLTATGISIVFDRVTESKIRIGLSGGLTADSTGIAITSPNLYNITGFHH